MKLLKQTSASSKRKVEVSSTERERESADWRKSATRERIKSVSNLTSVTLQFQLIIIIFSVLYSSIVFRLRFHCRFMHDSPHFYSFDCTNEPREAEGAEAREEEDGKKTRTRRHVVSVIGWMVVTHFVDNATKTIEIEIRLYCSGCHFNASNRSKMSVQNIRYYVHFCSVNGSDGKQLNKVEGKKATHTHTLEHTTEYAVEQERKTKEMRIFQFIV